MKRKFFNFTYQFSDSISLNCFNIRSTIVLGLYYGFLVALPIGPSQLIYIRTYLLNNQGIKYNLSLSTILRKNKLFIICLSGIIIPQFIIFASMANLPFIPIFNKPHIWVILILPSIFFYWNSIKYFDRSLIFDNETSILSFNMFQTFLSSLIFQIFNPILFPNSTYTRLISVFLFRYNESSLFLLGSITGYISSQLLFVLFNWKLLSKIEQNIPTIYRLIKRIIHYIFSSVFFLVLCIYGAKYSSIERNFKHIPQIHMLSTKPNLFFPNYQWNQNFILSNTKSSAFIAINSIRLKKNNTSQYNFHICFNQGKIKLFHNVPDTLCHFNNKIFSNTKSKSLNLKTFVFNQLDKQKTLHEALETFMINLDNFTNKEYKNLFLHTHNESQFVQANNFLKQLQNEKTLSLYTHINTNKINEFLKINFNIIKRKKLSAWKTHAEDYLKLEKNKIYKNEFKLQYMYRYIFGSLRPSIRRSKGFIFKILTKKMNSPFIVRVKNKFILKKQVKLQLKPNVNMTTGKLTHIIRSPALRLQAVLRKYIKLPIFILIKNSIRSILFQQSEWEYDWIQWKKEEYIYCKLDGTPYDSTELKVTEIVSYLRPVEIQIHSPFHIKPWITTDSINLIESDSYLDIWGNEFEFYSKKWKYKPSFFKPVLKSIQLILTQKIYFTLAKIAKNLNVIIQFREQLILEWNKRTNLLKINNKKYINNNNDLKIEMTQTNDSEKINHFRNQNQNILTKKSINNSFIYFKSLDIDTKKEPLLCITNNTTDGNFNLFFKKIKNQLISLKNENIYSIKLSNPSLNNLIFFNKLRISVLYKYYELENKLIYIKYNIIKTLTEIKIILLKIHIWLYQFVKKITDIIYCIILKLDCDIRLLSLKLNQILQKNLNIIFLNIKYLSTIIDFKFNFNFLQSNSLSNGNSKKKQIRLSKYYILYHIWQNQSNNLITESLLQQPKYITKSIWEQCIQLYDNYITPYDIWKDISSYKWSNELKDNYHKLIISQKNDFIMSKSNNVKQIENDLKYHDILIQHIRKTNKINKINQLIYSYYNSIVTTKNLIKSKHKLIHNNLNSINQSHLLTTNSFNNVISTKLISTYKKVIYYLKRNIEQLDTLPLDLDKYEETEESDEKYLPFLNYYNTIETLLKIKFNLKPRANKKKWKKNTKWFFDYSMLTSNFIHPYLNSINKQIVSDNMYTKEFVHFFFPEELFLTNTVMKLRIIEYFNNNIKYNSSNQIKSDCQYTTFNINNYIKRSLWPIHYLENLACMNRFGIGTGNQSRFSNLRIKMYSL